MDLPELITMYVIKRVSQTICYLLKNKWKKIT